MQHSQPSRHGVSRKSLKMAEGKDENETLGEEETSARKPLRKQPVWSHLVCSALSLSAGGWPRKAQSGAGGSSKDAGVWSRGNNC